ncbi:MAG: VWA domain-containing protein [Candidatus Pacearchaeota archaeon]
MVFVITFENQKYLFILLMVPFIFFIYIISYKIKRSNALKFANFEAIERIKGISFYSRDLLELLITLLVLISMTFSLAGFSVGRMVDVSTSSFVLSIDTSNSMLADDFKPSRLEAAKFLSEEFVKAVPDNTRIGVLSFSLYPIVEQEITEDKSKTILAIRNIEPSKVGGTNIKGVIETSHSMLLNEENKNIIILSDGQINLGDFNETLDYVKEKRLIVHSILIGTKEGGETGFGFVSKVESEGYLKPLSNETNGGFYMANSQEDLRRAFNEILKSKKSLIFTNLSKQFLILSLLLFLIGFLYRSLRGKFF